MIRFLLILLFTLFLSSYSYGDDFELKGEQLKIFQNTLKGSIDKKAHNRFWSLVEKKEMNSILKNKSAFDKLINENILLAYRYQQEFWKSLLITFRERQIFKTDLYNKYKSILKTKPYAKQAIKNSEGMLLAASKRVIYNSSSGPMYPDDKMAEKILPHLEKAFTRIAKLINPIWEE